MKGLLIIILMVIALVYSVFTFIPERKESNAGVSSQSSSTVMHVDTRISRNLE